MKWRKRQIAEDSDEHLPVTEGGEKAALSIFNQVNTTFKKYRRLGL